MTALLVIGVVLEVVGIVTVIVAVDSLAADLFPARLLPITRAKRWWRTRKMPPVVGQVHALEVADSMMISDATGSLTVTAAQTVAQRLDQLAARLTEVATALGQESDARTAALNEIHSELDAERARREAAVSEVESAPDSGSAAPMARG